MKKYALLFGAGKDSYILLKKYKKYKPILITIIGEKDDIYPQVIYDIGKANKLKTIVIEKNSSFNNLISVRNKKFVKLKTNVSPKILNKFDVILCGRKRKDIVETKAMPTNEIPHKFNKTNNIICPLYAK